MANEQDKKIAPSTDANKSNVSTTAPERSKFGDTKHDDKKMDQDSKVEPKSNSPEVKRS